MLVVEAAGLGERGRATGAVACAIALGALEALTAGDSVAITAGADDGACVTGAELATLDAGAATLEARRPIEATTKIVDVASTTPRPAYASGAHGERFDTGRARGSVTLVASVAWSAGCAAVACASA